MALWAGLAFARGVCPLGVCFSPRTDATGPVGEDNRGLSVGGGGEKAFPEVDVCDQGRVRPLA